MIKDISIRYGLIAGVATSGYYLLFYLINKSMMLQPAIYWSSLIPLLTCMYLGSRAYGQSQSGDYGLTQALKTSFTIYTLGAALLYLLIYYLLYQIADPSLLEMEQDIALQRLEANKGNFSDQQYDRLRESLENTSSRNLLLNLGQSLVGGFIFSLIIAYFTKDK